MSNTQILEPEEQKYALLLNTLQQKQQVMQRAEAEIRDVSVQLLKAEGRITMLRELIQAEAAAVAAEAAAAAEFPEEITEEVS